MNRFDKRAILVVEADPQLRRLLLQILESWGIDARHAEDLATAVPASLMWAPFGAIICGQTLPDGTGTLFFRWLREQVVTVPFLLISEGSAPDIKDSARFGFLSKPFNMPQLRVALSRLAPEILPSHDGLGMDRAAAESEDGLAAFRRKTDISAVSL